MHAYLVGGAVRDALLGLPVQDRDWVVVGSNPAAMVAAGYVPVGKDFPVFLHPESHEEYALARTERKTAPGYHGFAFHAAPEVTLEQDLARRDLTINAMAQDADSGEIVDPYGGRRDIEGRVLRHVSPAFAEDPVRILRLARFAARFSDFTVAPETVELMRGMVAAGEVDELVAERVWQELSRGLMESRPSRMFEVLRDCGALARLLPEVERLFGVPQPPAHHPEVDTGVHLLMVLDQCARLQTSLAVRYACLCHDLGKGTTPADILPRHIGHEQRSADLARQVSERWRVPNDCRELADLVAREHGNVHRSTDFDATARLRLLERSDAWRKPGRFEQMLWACECDARGRLGLEDRDYPQRERLMQDLAATQAED
ncbi:multifunctional CCA addition/repair protein, partial [Pelomonas sp. KK5]|uniref:multifunctional CCA addition/repair protein n=1 Tax=Pelomonas sp. KK5 TaxID=1855730 RepID=UPI00097CAAA8